MSGERKKTVRPINEFRTDEDAMWKRLREKNANERIVKMYGAIRQKYIYAVDETHAEQTDEKRY